MSTTDKENDFQLAPAPVDTGRRKLGIGLGAGALFTLASRPVLAGQCLTPSAAASGNLSHHGPVKMCQCGNLDSWLAESAGAGAQLSTQFHSVFTVGPYGNWNILGQLGVVIGSSTFLEVMLAAKAGLNTQTHPNPISAEFVVTLLNIRSGCVPADVLTETALRTMWTEFANSGAFSPKTGVTWNADQIVAYLRTLQA